MISYKKELTIRSIKLIDLAYTSIIYIIPTFYVSIFLNKYLFPKINVNKDIPDEEKSTEELLIELSLCVALIGITSYILRNLLQLIPFPLHGVKGYDHYKVKEVMSGQWITLVLFRFSTHMINRLVILQKRTVGNTENNKENNKEIKKENKEFIKMMI